MDERNPQDHVFTLVELVTAILLHADMTPLELLVARRINKTFNDVILHALPFRRILFLEADTTSTESEVDPNQVEVNPFLEKIFPQCAKSYFDLVLHRRYIHGRRISDLHGSDEREVFICQGHICKRCYSRQIDLASLQHGRLFVHLPLLQTYDEEDYFPAALWNEYAIWRRMYVTRPVLPIHVVEASPVVHKWEIAPATPLGEVLPRLVVGNIVFSAQGPRAEDVEDTDMGKKASGDEGGNLS
jgi:hypothetical protein